MTIHRAGTSPGCGCDGQDARTPLITIDEALARIAAQSVPVNGTETLALEQSAGRILARPVRARSMAPPFDNAAMDGFAVSTAALVGEGPWALQVIARVPAGHGSTSRVGGASAARIFTGAPIPDGADAVVMQEDVVRDGDVVRVCRRPAPGLNIRRKGSDMMAGVTVLDEGHRLNPRAIAVCAAAGAGCVQVRARLRAAVIVTGDEVRQSGNTRGASQIWDVNAPMMTALLTDPAIELALVSHAPDCRKDLARQFADLATRFDLVVTTGGISVGEEDHVKPALGELDADILFSGVAIKPGKPVSFGRIGGALWLGLPGNPLSAFVTWQFFGTALVRRLTGQTSGNLRRRHAVTADTIHRKAGRCELRPVTIMGLDAQGREVVRFEEALHSGRVGMLPATDGLLLLPAEADHLPAGALVEFKPYLDRWG